MNARTITGGCQCGAVRYALYREPDNSHICHCRMCQKAFGSYFAPLARVPTKDFEVTRGGIAIFRSSDPVERGFCRDCGTPLTFRYCKGTDHISIALGSLDHPERVKPTRQFGMESRIPWLAELDSLPGSTTEEWGAAKPAWMAETRGTNRQHPDHDTEIWPSEATR